MRVLLLACIITLSGCVTTVGPEPVDIVTEIPGVALAEMPFSFEMDVAGHGFDSDHVGAHYWSTSTGDPDGDFAAAKGCAHAGEMLTFPMTVTVTCTLPAGTHYVRGHVRETGTDGPINHWGPETRIDVVDWQLVADSEGGSVAAGEGFTFNVIVAGDGSASSSHVGAHHWTSPPADPSAEFSAAGGCAHQPEPITLPGAFEVTCTWEEAGEYTVHGHVRLGSGDHTYNLWSQAITVTVS